MPFTNPPVWMVAVGFFSRPYYKEGCRLPGHPFVFFASSLFKRFQTPKLNGYFSADVVLKIGTYFILANYKIYHEDSKDTKMEFEPLSNGALACAIDVHPVLGLDFLELTFP